MDTGRCGYDSKYVIFTFYWLRPYWRSVHTSSGTGPSLTTATCCCSKNFSQWKRSFLWKLRCHWLKGLRQHQSTVVRQSPGFGHKTTSWTRMLTKFFGAMLPWANELKQLIIIKYLHCFNSFIILRKNYRSFRFCISRPQIWIKLQQVSHIKMHLKVLSAKWQPFCLSLNVLMCRWYKNSGWNLAQFQNKIWVSNCNQTLQYLIILFEWRHTISKNIEEITMSKKLWTKFVRLVNNTVLTGHSVLVSAKTSARKVIPKFRVCF